MTVAAPPKVGCMSACLCLSFASSSVYVLHACYPFLYVSPEVTLSLVTPWDVCLVEVSVSWFHVHTRVSHSRYKCTTAELLTPGQTAACMLACLLQNGRVLPFDFDTVYTDCWWFHKQNTPSTKHHAQILEASNWLSLISEHGVLIYHCHLQASLILLPIGRTPRFWCPWTNLLGEQAKTLQWLFILPYRLQGGSTQHDKH